MLVRVAVLLAAVACGTLAQTLQYLPTGTAGPEAQSGECSPEEVIAFIQGNLASSPELQSAVGEYVLRPVSTVLQSASLEQVLTFDLSMCDMTADGERSELCDLPDVYRDVVAGVAHTHRMLLHTLTMDEAEFRQVFACDDEHTEAICDLASVIRHAMNGSRGSQECTAMDLLDFATDPETYLRLLLDDFQTCQLADPGSTAGVICQSIYAQSILNRAIAGLIERVSSQGLAAALMSNHTDCQTPEDPVEGAVCQLMAVIGGLMGGAEENTRPRTKALTAEDIPNVFINLPMVVSTLADLTSNPDTLLQIMAYPTPAEFCAESTVYTVLCDELPLADRLLVFDLLETVWTADSAHLLLALASVLADSDSVMHVMSHGAASCEAADDVPGALADICGTALMDSSVTEAAFALIHMLGGPVVVAMPMYCAAVAEDKGPLMDALAGVLGAFYDNVLASQMDCFEDLDLEGWFDGQGSSGGALRDLMCDCDSHGGKGSEDSHAWNIVLLLLLLIVMVLLLFVIYLQVRMIRAMAHAGLKQRKYHLPPPPPINDTPGVAANNKTITVPAPAHFTKGGPNLVGYTLKAPDLPAPKTIPSPPQYNQPSAPKQVTVAMAGEKRASSPVDSQHSEGSSNSYSELTPVDNNSFRR